MEPTHRSICTNKQVGRAALCAHKLWWTADRKGKNNIHSFLIRHSLHFCFTHFVLFTESQVKRTKGKCMKNEVWVQMFRANLRNFPFNYKLSSMTWSSLHQKEYFSFILNDLLLQLGQCFASTIKNGQHFQVFRIQSNPFDAIKQKHNGPSRSQFFECLTFDGIQ